MILPSQAFYQPEKAPKIPVVPGERREWGGVVC